MSDKKVKLKEDDAKFLYPKTSAWLVEGLAPYIDNILNPVERTAIKDFLQTRLTENNLSVVVNESKGDYIQVTFNFPPFSEKALKAFEKYGISNLRLVLFRHRNRCSSNRGSRKYLRMYIAYDSRTYVSPNNTGSFHQGKATLLGPDSFSPIVTIDELRLGRLTRDLQLNANGDPAWYDPEGAYYQYDGMGAGRGMAPAAITNRRIDGNIIDGSGDPTDSKYQRGNVGYGLPLYQDPDGYNVLYYPDGWRTGFRIGFIYVNDPANNGLYESDTICTVPFSIETITDSYRREDY